MSYARTSLKGVTFYDSTRAYNGLTLFTPVEGKGAWLVDMMGRRVNYWETAYYPGYDAKLLPNGNLLYAGRVDSGPLADLEGAGGILLEIDWDGNLVWEYKDPYLHHTFDRMGNGNTLVLKWVRLPDDTAARVKGGDPGTERDGAMWGDAIQEVTPGGRVVWEWVAHESIDPGATRRCPICPRSTWGHANSVSALSDGNLLVSFAFTNTIAIVDRKTGGVKWQWGPYKEGDQAPGDLSHQHCPTMLDNGNILVFDNGMHPGGFAFSFSRVVEVSPTTGDIAWVYGGGDVAGEFYSPMLGSCQRLPNRNTLICEGTTGRIFEVTPSLQLAWEFVNNLPAHEPYPAQTRSHMVCSAYRYGMDYAGLKQPVSQPTEREPAPGTPTDGGKAVEKRLQRLGY